MLSEKQSGTVLIVSLVLLAVMTVVTVLSISRSNLQGRISKNFEYDVVTYQGSESSINLVLNSSNIYDEAGYSADQDLLLQAAEDSLKAVPVTASYNMDPHDNLINVNVTSDATIIQTKQGGCWKDGDSVGSGSPIQCAHFEISSETNISDVGAKTVHVQGVSRPVPKRGLD